MQVQFKCRAPHARDLRELASSRLSAALQRLATQVPRVTVELSDVNGPRGGVDKRCQISLHTAGSGTVIVNSIASRWRAAFDDALARALRLLARLLHRGERRATPLRRLGTSVSVET
ncbi:MAG: HPF/RaiA family ribosome-associated protein [Burkholderiales bacterium]|uniref:HPF/RaiA family ribosome-associated protein n=1 Tax=Roseateles sp. TaxID=1971397 RepID=UPI000FBAEC31|nr:MAG: HPF/RaiA family ribosome-associated protein [Burkholderiales bacterium]